MYQFRKVLRTTYGGHYFFIRNGRLKQITSTLHKICTYSRSIIQDVRMQRNWLWSRHEFRILTLQLGFGIMKTAVGIQSVTSYEYAITQHPLIAYETLSNSKATHGFIKSTSTTPHDAKKVLY